MQMKRKGSNLSNEFQRIHYDFEATAACFRFNKSIRMACSTGTDSNKPFSDYFILNQFADDRNCSFYGSLWYLRTLYVYIN